MAINQHSFKQEKASLMGSFLLPILLIIFFEPFRLFFLLFEITKICICTGSGCMIKTYAMIATCIQSTSTSIFHIRHLLILVFENLYQNIRTGVRMSGLLVLAIIFSHVYLP